MEMRTEEHCLRRQVGIGSESDCLLDSCARSWRFQIHKSTCHMVRSSQTHLWRVDHS